MELESLHLTTLILTAVVILYADHKGFLYMRGKVETLPYSLLLWAHRLVWVGLIGMILTGFFLVRPLYDYYLTDPVFYVKMGFVLVLVMNAYAIGTLSHLAATKPFKDLTVVEKRTLMTSGALSWVGWVGAAIIGLFFL